ncbi:MAG: hypothetical protein ACP5I4_11690 [Oceanipulchritudo sp.]
MKTSFTLIPKLRGLACLSALAVGLLATPVLHAQTLVIPQNATYSGRVTAATVGNSAVSTLSTGSPVRVGDNPSNQEFAYMITFDMSSALELLAEDATVTLELETDSLFGANGPAPASLQVSILGAGPLPANTGELYAYETGTAPAAPLTVSAIPVQLPPAARRVLSFNLTDALAALTLDGTNDHIVMIVRARDYSSGLWSNSLADQLLFVTSGTRLIVDPAKGVKQDANFSGRVNTTAGPGTTVGNLAKGDEMIVGDNPSNQEFVYIMSFDLGEQLGAIADGAALTLSLTTNGVNGANGPAPVPPTVSFIGAGPLPTDNGVLYAYENGGAVRVDLGTVPANPTGVQQTYTFSATAAIASSTLDASNSYAFFIVRCRDYTSALWTNGAADQTRFTSLRTRLMVDTAKRATQVDNRSGRVNTGTSDFGGAIGNLATASPIRVGDNPTPQEFAYIITMDASAVAGEIEAGNPVTLVLGPDGTYGANGPAPVAISVDYLGNGPAPADTGAVYAYENSGTPVNLGSIPNNTLNKDYYFDMTSALASADLSGGDDHLFFIARCRPADYTDPKWTNALADQTLFAKPRTQLKIYGESLLIIPTTFSVTTQSSDDGTPFGYQDVSGGVDDAKVLNLSAIPYLDYLVPTNSGAPAIQAQKATGAFITASTVADLDATSTADTDQVAFDWSDGDPTASGDNYYGTATATGTAATTVTLETRVDLAQDGPLTVTHWWNDPWDYGASGSLPGHVLTIERYNALDELVDVSQTVHTASTVPGYYTGKIRITRDAAGDYLIIRNTGHALGYSGTAVSGPSLADTFSVTTATTADGDTPFGYQDVSGGVDALEVIDLSRAPFLDYLVASNATSAGVETIKSGAGFITSTTVASLTGGADAADATQVVFDWSDGDPVASGDDYYGVSRGAASGAATETLTTRVDLLQDGLLEIVHWWGDSHDYFGTATLPGHLLTVSLYDAGNVLQDQFVAAYAGDGSPAYYTSVIAVSRQAAGDYVVITNEGHGLTYSGTAVAGPKLASGISVTTTAAADGGFGWQSKSDPGFPGDPINVSGPGWADYLLPKNSGSVAPWTRAQKIGGAYLTASTIDSFTGGANNSDNLQVVFEWSDGTPTLAATDYYGVTWTGWDNTTESTLATRVELPDDNTVTVFHWWNDGWNYSSPSILLGHIINVTLYDAFDTPVDSFEAVYPGGFYTTIVAAARQDPGDYLVIKNTGHNIGYRGTAVQQATAPETVSIVPLGNDMEISFMSLPGLSYSIEVSYGNLGGWTLLDGPEPGTGGVLTFLHSGGKPAAGARVFYRIIAN